MLCILSHLLLILSCYFDPIYTDNSIETANNIEIIIENGDDIDIFEVIVKASDMNSIHFYQNADNKRINLSVKQGDDRDFAIIGYVDTTCKYFKTFTADISDDDTTFKITLTEVGGPIPVVPQNVSLGLLSGDTVKISWDESANAEKYVVYKKKSLSGDEAAIGITDSTVLPDSDVLPGHTYFYGVSAFNSMGESDISPYKSIDIPGSVEVPCIFPGVTLHGKN